MRTRGLLCLLSLFAAQAAFGLTTKSIADGLTAADIVAAITGPGATIYNVQITGANVAIGTFASSGISLDSGVILSTGNIADANGPNISSGTGTSLGTPGDTSLNAIVAPYTTHDAVVLEFDVITTTPIFQINYVFASEEYDEYVGSAYNDVFAFYVDGNNIALTPGTINPVTINTINAGSNPDLFIENAGGQQLEYDGYTVPLQAVGIVEPNVPHHIKIAIADTSDAILDSAVFIAQGGISGESAPTIIPQNPVLMGSDETLTLPTPIYNIYDQIPYNIEASGLPGASVTFSPVYLGADGNRYTDMKITPGPDAQPGAHLVTLHVTTAHAETFATFLAVVDCRPPMILAAPGHQPVDTTAGSDGTATLSVSPIGTDAFQYQWYLGHTGQTNFPISGATGAALTTPVVSQPTEFWVRISNPCGSIDSASAVVSPQ